MIEQEFSLFSELNVFQNIFLGREYSRKMKFIIDWKNIKRKTQEMLQEFGINININKTMKRLKTSEQQLIEIIKAVFFGASFIIMDEPTSSLGEREKEKLFKIIKTLKEKGVGIIYISHKINEIYEIADLITVMRDGRKVGTYSISDIDEPNLIKLMVGRELTDIFYRDKKSSQLGSAVLEIKNLTKKGSFNNISFSVRAGEILGLSGLMGSQRTEIMRCVFGLDKFDSGEILFENKPIRPRSSFYAINRGIGMVPEDRKKEGILQTMSVKENLSISLLNSISRFGWINITKEREIAIEQVNRLNIKIVSLNQPITKLSGGNQQKVILGRFLCLKPKLLILDEPTRGIDVGAKAEVHKIIAEIAKLGVAIIMISSELPEIIGASERIIVLHEGRITGEFNHLEASQEKIMESSLK
jgi:ribose transport system ATP-binding protein